MEEKEDKNNKAVFSADKVHISGPLMDGGFKVSFSVGEYQYDNIKDLPNLNGKVLVVAVVQGDELSKKDINPIKDQEGWSEKTEELYDGQERE